MSSIREITLKAVDANNKTLESMSKSVRLAYKNAYIIS